MAIPRSHAGTSPASSQPQGYDARRKGRSLGAFLLVRSILTHVLVGVVSVACVLGGAWFGVASITAQANNADTAMQTAVCAQGCGNVQPDTEPSAGAVLVEKSGKPVCASHAGTAEADDDVRQPWEPDPDGGTMNITASAVPGTTEPTRKCLTPETAPGISDTGAQPGNIAAIADGEAAISASTVQDNLGASCPSGKGLADGEHTSSVPQIAGTDDMGTSPLVTDGSDATDCDQGIDGTQCDDCDTSGLDGGSSSGKTCGPDDTCGPGSTYGSDDTCGPGTACSCDIPSGSDAPSGSECEYSYDMMSDTACTDPDIPAECDPIDTLPDPDREDAVPFTEPEPDSHSVPPVPQSHPSAPVPAPQPSTPVLDPSNGSIISGLASPSTTVVITDAQGVEIPGCARISPDPIGVFSCSPSIYLPAGFRVLARASDSAGNISDTAEAEISPLIAQAVHVTRYPGQTQTVVGRNFNPGERICLPVNGVQTSLCRQAGPDGIAAIDYAVPADLPLGTHVATLTGEISHMASTSFTVAILISAGGTVVAPVPPLRINTMAQILHTLLDLVRPF